MRPKISPGFSDRLTSSSARRPPKFLTIEPAHKLKIDQNKLQNCRSNILNLVNVL
ncbi:hypothetical protein D1AOALGA4SA_4903 [Olavius algarvensis Delta 1 endosymbiont]|nr:hypothetical protein D1AOALGA4SA_4903 [Olavius algarvensis Delta 1 endosymbiont]